MMTTSKAKPKAKGASRVSKPRTAATKSLPKAGAKAKSPPKPGTKAKPAADANRAAGKAAARLPASRLIDQPTRDPGWRGQTLARVRALILEADPEMIEERKWRKPSNSMAGVPVWSHGGIVCTGESYAKIVKLTFARGASIPDPSRLFNSSLEGSMRRAIDIHEGEKVDSRAFRMLVQAAVAENLRSSAPTSKSTPQGVAKTKPTASKAKPSASNDKPGASNDKREAKPVKLLSGGNPQIAKADGDAPVQMYIAAMPGWKSELGKRLDALIVRTVPKVRKAVRWNSPFYGIEGQGWFLSFHVLTRYVKVNFFRGESLVPVPPGAGKDKDARWIDIYEVDKLDEAQMAKWVKQAAKLPGWVP